MRARPRLRAMWGGLLIVLACGRPDRGTTDGARTLTVRGSDTMVILAQSWAEAFMRARPGTRVQVSGGGTGTGLTALIDGTADVATASRPISPVELERIAEERGEVPVGTEVAIDAIAIYVHRDNPIEALTPGTVKRIFRGHLRDWAELGVDLGPIVLYSRENNSGTYAFFKEHVLDDEDLAAEAQTLPGTAAVIHAVSRDPGAIGYGGIGYATGVRVVPLRVDGVDISPDVFARSAGGYPLVRALWMYTVGVPEGVAADYVAFARSTSGQAVVESLGFFPLHREQAR